MDESYLVIAFGTSGKYKVLKIPVVGKPKTDDVRELANAICKYNDTFVWKPLICLGATLETKKKETII